jgi:hypothetical protein
MDSPTRTDPLQHAIMLTDLTYNLQRLSASLPPDGWDPDSARRQIQRVASGVLDLRQHDRADGILTRPVEVLTRPSAEDLSHDTDGLLAPEEQDNQRDATNRDQSQEERCGIWARIVSLGCCLPNCHNRSATSGSKSVYERVKTGIMHLWPFHKPEVKERITKRDFSGEQPLL